MMSTVVSYDVFGNLFGKVVLRNQIFRLQFHKSRRHVSFIDTDEKTVKCSEYGLRDEP